jgi:ubiquinone/menaquinone biosynthesis C-methylase UbiE
VVFVLEAPVPQPSAHAPPWLGWFSARGFLARRCDAAELLDSDDLDPTELAENLRDICTVNRLAGGVTTVLRHLPELVCRVPRGRPVESLDLATGSGDIPYAVLAWAARNARPLLLTVSDRSPAMLDIAREMLTGYDNVSFDLHDARAVPLPEGAFDIVLCSLSLHHFAPPDAVHVLREMDRLSRTGFIVNDVRRCMAGYLAAWMASRVATGNRLTRHDMPLSVRRAYTPRELTMLLQEAGVHDAAVTTHPLFRMAAVHCRGC